VGCVTLIFEAAFLFLGRLGVVLSIPFQVLGYVVSGTTLAVIFFDLEIRNNAGDLRAMVELLEAAKGQA
jgi:hypothetical protein